MNGLSVCRGEPNVQVRSCPVVPVDDPTDRAEFLEDTLKALPYRAHTVLTYNGVQFAKKAGTKTYKPHIFDVVCHRYGLANEALHPWTNGQVKRMNRTIKEVTTRAFHCTSLEQ